MNKLGVALAVSLLLLGCAGGSLSELAHENQTNIAKLKVGMTRAAVVEHMGTKSASTHDGQIANPFRTESFQGRSGARYEVLYYVTERRRFRPVHLELTTPLVLRNGVLTGWGMAMLQQAKNDR